MRTRTIAGFSLVEVLVAILVLALGLLGAAAMQLAALRTRHQSTLLSHTVRLASGMADKMRANVEQMRHDDSDNPYLGVDYDAATDAGEAVWPERCFSAVGCDSAQLASFDIAEVKQQLRRALPGARLVICRDAAQWDDAANALSWACSGAVDAPVVIKLGWQSKNPDGTLSRERVRPGLAIRLDRAAP